MQRLMIVCLALCLPVFVAAGCSDKAKVEKKTTESTPGGKTTTTESTTVEKSGSNPPAANP